jgi:hypothetical protein
MKMFAFLCLTPLLALPAFGEAVKTRVGSTGTEPGSPSVCSTTGMLPPDDLDPLMREWYLRSLGGCEDNLLGCEPTTTTMAYGGDRMANYLIHQYETNEATTGCVGAHYLRMIGFTRSPIGIQYLIHETDNPHSPQRDQAALGALMYSASQQAIDKAFDVLQRPGQEHLRGVAVYVIHANAIKMGHLLPSDEVLMRRLEKDRTPGLYGYSSRALKDLEQRGIIAPQAHPVELEMWKP